ncbi:MAG: hypothetical protein P1P64_04345 [Treponemataceae bacterium]
MDKFIICTVGTSIANSCPEQKKLFKSQAGWDADPVKIKAELDKSVKEKAPNLKSGDNNYRTLSAETNTLDRLGLSKNDKIALITTDNLLGNVCSAKLKSILLEVYGMSEPQVEIKRIKDLQISDIKKVRQTGLKNLISTVLDLLKENQYGYEIIFNPVGGYKFVLPFITIIAMLYGKRSIYIFEHSEELLNIPALPFTFDINIFRRAKPALDLIEEKTEIHIDKFLNSIVGYVDSERDMFMSFTEPGDKPDFVTLSPLAWCFMEIDDGREKAQISETAKKQLAKIENEASGQAIKRIIKNAENPTWRNVNLHRWDSIKDLSVLKCKSGERVIFYMDKEIVKVVYIYTSHNEYERKFSNLSLNNFIKENFTPCDFTDYDFGCDDDDIDGVYQERNQLQINIKKLQEENIKVQEKNLQRQELQDKNLQLEEINKKLKSENQNVLDELSQQSQIISELKSKIEKLDKLQKKQKSFVYRLKHLFTG